MAHSSTQGVEDETQRAIYLAQIEAAEKKPETINIHSGELLEEIHFEGRLVGLLLAIPNGELIIEAISGPQGTYYTANGILENAGGVLTWRHVGIWEIPHPPGDHLHVRRLLHARAEQDTYFLLLGGGDTINENGQLGPYNR